MSAATAWQVRPLEAGDLEDVRRIYNHAVRHTDATLDTDEKSLDDMAAWLDKHGGRYAALGVEVAGRVAGYAALSPFAARGGYLASAEISTYVDPDHAGSGIGRALVVALTDHAAEAGFSTVLALITSTNVAPKRIVLSLGYRYFGVLRCIGCKLGRLVDLEIYQRVFDGNLARYGGPPPAAEPQGGLP